MWHTRSDRYLRAGSAVWRTLPDSLPAIQHCQHGGVSLYSASRLGAGFSSKRLWEVIDNRRLPFPAMHLGSGPSNTTVFCGLIGLLTPVGPGEFRITRDLSLQRTQPFLPDLCLPCQLLDTCLCPEEDDECKNVLALSLPVPCLQKECTCTWCTWNRECVSFEGIQYKMLRVRCAKLRYSLPSGSTGPDGFGIRRFDCSGFS